MWKSKKGETCCVQMCSCDVIQWGLELLLYIACDVMVLCIGMRGGVGTNVVPLLVGYTVRYKIMVFLALHSLLKKICIDKKIVVEVGKESIFFFDLLLFVFLLCIFVFQSSVLMRLCL